MKYEYCYSNGEFFVDMSNCTADSTPRVDETFYPNGELKSRTNYHSKNDVKPEINLVAISKALKEYLSQWDNIELGDQVNYRGGK